MMKRTRKRKQCDAILSSDIHIRKDVPMARIDEYQQAQFDKLDFIFNLCETNNAPLLVGGDFGDKSQWPNWLLEKTIQTIRKYKVNIIVIPGQHDLPEHRIDFKEKSGCGVLHSAGIIDLISEPLHTDKFIVYPYGYGQDMQNIEKNDKPSIAMTHQMVIKKKPLWCGQVAPKGNSLLKKYPCYDLILSGDNHNHFTADLDGRHLVNPGSMMRMTAAQEDHEPCVYKWFASTNTIEQVYLPINKDVITREHIENEQNKSERIEKLKSKMDTDFKFELSFEENMEEYLKTNKPKENIINKIWKTIEEV